MEFEKICKNPRCRKHFVSSARNAAYCSKECQESYYLERSKRRKKYKSQDDENRLVSKAYSLANAVADIFYPEHVCSHCGKPSTHVHHIDINVFNNSPENLTRLCEKCHKLIHSSLPNVNMVNVLTKCKKSESKLSVFKESVKDVLSNE